MKKTLYKIKGVKELQKEKPVDLEKLEKIVVISSELVRLFSFWLDLFKKVPKQIEINSNKYGLCMFYHEDHVEACYRDYYSNEAIFESYGETKRKAKKDLYKTLKENNVL